MIAVKISLKAKMPKFARVCVCLCTIYMFAINFDL